jgi:hypothetical protein
MLSAARRRSLAARLPWQSSFCHVIQQKAAVSRLPLEPSTVVMKPETSMNRPLLSLTGLLVVLPLAAGCASRTAPFNEMDQAQITVLRLQGQEPPPQPAAQPAVAPGIPGLPPELQAVGQQIGQAVNQALPGLIPPGLLPGAPAAPVQPATPPPPRFKQFIILGQQPLTDESLKNEILDIFGSESSFQADRGNCFFPGMGISMQRAPQANQAPLAPVDLLISLSCNQAMGDGFAWPYKVNGFTPETHQRLTKVYERLFGPVPPGS